MRVTAQLVDAAAGGHVWAERYDRDLSDIFAVQDEITASVAGIIEPALAEAEQQRVLRKSPERLDAWEAYQRGLWHFHKYGPEDNKTALTFFRQAIALDPNFAPGHYGYALALQWDIWYYSTRSFLEVQGTAREEAHIAVSLDDKDAMAHAVLAHMMMWGGEWEAAIAEARTALALNPNSAFVISMLGCVLGFGGYRDEALDRLRTGHARQPARSVDLAVDALARDYPVFLTRFRRRAGDARANLFACVRGLLTPTNSSPPRSPILADWTKRAKRWNASRHNRRSRFSVVGRDCRG